MDYRYDKQSGPRTGEYNAKRYKVIACKVMMREMYLLACQCHNVIDILWLKQALHDTPDILRTTVQQAIDDIEQEEQRYDAILLGYGLCSNGVVGLTSRETPLVIPRAHDCITLFLGSKERYRSLFDSVHGIYWYTPGWIEQSLMPGKARVESLKAYYTEKYGEDNADYLMEMEQGWLKEYENCMYVQWPGIQRDDCVEYTKKAAEYLQWDFTTVDGSPSLMQEMFDGVWHQDRFLVLQKGQTIAPSFDELILKAETSQEATGV